MTAERRICTYNVAGPQEPDRRCGRTPVVAHVIAGQDIAAELCERHARAARSAVQRIRATGARAPRIVEVSPHA